MRIRGRALFRFGALALSLVAPQAAAAQHDHATPVRAQLGIGAHAVPLLTHATPVLRGSGRTEAVVTQPTLFVHAAWRGLRLDGTVSLEALTIADGELAPGGYGEGYVDRRHPHTYLHELMLTAAGSLHGVHTSLSAGRGFAPFGTDDPMMRPFVKFPVNHHLGQVLERLVVSGGVRYGPVMLEGGVFSGAEPLDAEDMGSFDHFADSWAARATLLPFDGVEVQASRARLESPEFPLGGGWDQRKWSASARIARPFAIGTVYALGEWKRTTHVERGRDIFSSGSFLVEAALDAGGWRPGLRFERTDRPEEERLADPFRTAWPHAGGHVLGITRWNITSARLERALVFRGFDIAPFAESHFAHVQDRVQGPFSPDDLYGSRNIWMFSAGARLRAGSHPPRMGRYGVAAQVAADHAH